MKPNSLLILRSVLAAPTLQRLALLLAMVGWLAFLSAGCNSVGSGPSSHVTTAGDGTVTLRDFSLVGDLTNDHAAFTLSATAHVDGAKGGSLDLLAGPVALTEVGSHPHWDIGVDGNKFVLKFDHGGDYGVQLKFSAAVAQNNGWNSIGFQVAASTLRPIVLGGLGPDTQFQFAGAARPDRAGSNFTSYLPADGSVRLSWKEARKEEEGKLFYAAQMLSQIAVGPGMMRQVALLDFKVMQGELNQVTLRVHGAGEVTGVTGDHVLAFSEEPVPNSTDRRLIVKLNQPQKDQFSVQVQMQTSLGEFPLEADAMELRPEGGTRFAGYFRIVNEGAVRLEIANAKGLSQISPEQFPDTPMSRAAFRSAGGQRFAYRFSGPDFALRIHADQVIPELTVSEVLSYHLGESEQVIDGEIELDIREAPLRELLLHVPKGYAVARVASGDILPDYFLRDAADSTNAELRLVYVQPVSGRQVVQLRLERNAALGTNHWQLPRVEVVHAKSVRGNVGVAADPGFRLTAERTQSLTEIATAFFPAKPPGLQTAFRLSDPDWSASVLVERLPQTIQADVLHLFSVGEGIAYGSSVINYVISGSPVSALKIELPEGYTNVEFTGKDVLPPQKTDGGYLVQLHTPVSGPYTLLVTYERPFKSQGETLAFTGARPLDVLSEQGYTLVISTYQFQVKPADVSTNLLALEPGEVPPEYRLFFDAPILAAYRYTARPFNLKLELSPLAQGDSLSQVVDRATITNRISKEGQVLTDVRYFVKNRVKTHFRLTLPDATDLWSATVNGLAVVPVKDGKASLIPLPQRADPNAVLIVDLKLARSKSADPRRLTVAAPIVGAPVMLEEWTLQPDPGQSLSYRGGSLTPVGGIADISGFVGLANLFKGSTAGDAEYWLFALIVLVGLSVMAWRWGGWEEPVKSMARHVIWSLAGVVMFAFALVALSKLGGLAGHVVRVSPHDLTFLAPIQQADSALTVNVSNLPENASSAGSIGSVWPALLALAVWVYGWLAGRGGLRAVALVLGWTLMAWAALRSPDGVPAFLWVVALFLVLQVALPILWRLWRMPRHAPDAGASPMTSSAPATLVLLVGGLTWLALSSPTKASAESPIAESVTQQIRVEGKFALATAKIHWDASRGEVLPLLLEPAVLTHVSYPEHSLKLEQNYVGNQHAEQLEALVAGTYDIEVQYQLQINSSAVENGFTLPTPFGLVNQLRVTLANLDVDVLSPQAVSVQRSTDGSNTVASLVLSPLAQAQIGWRPRSRDVKREKPVFFANFYQLYIPSAGVIEGVHYVIITPSQGELNELNFDVPAGATITDVFEPVQGQNNAARPAGASLVSLWRFDPDTRRLRVDLRTAQSQKFGLVIRSQVATGTLPVEQTVGLVAVQGAAQQNGYLGVATGSDVQLDSVSTATNTVSSIFLGDFPAELAQSLQGQIPGITMRRAYQYVDPKGTATVKASAVEPDVRVETQGTLSLGEDRTVLAVNANVDIERAGIFKLSFVLPPGMDVDSISGKALSHWTDSKTDAGRLITMNLLGKTDGQQQFAIGLAGPGIKATNGWAVPQLVLREASKQQGTIVVVPEQGMQLQAAARDGVAELDPQKSGIRQKGVLAFRILQTQWNLSLNIEQLEPWIQVMSLQHAIVNEAQIRVTANLQYQIENTGLKTFHVLVPANAEGVRFQGDQLSVFSAVEGAVTNGLQDWEIKLGRRVIGQYLLQLNYQVPMSGQATATTLRGVQANDVNTQRGFVTVQSGGRLQLRVDATPAALQPAEWQSIPRALQKDLQTVSANFAYRLVEPAFDLPLQVERHEAEKLLPARVEDVTFDSVISDDGVMLTQARLDMVLGDKRLLNLKLPKGAKFWFAFVNQNGVWPWREGDNILIPLDQMSHDGKAVPVEIFFSSQAGDGGSHSLNLDLVAPKFDLPLENITWRVHLNDKWKIEHWSGQLQLETDQPAPAISAIDSQSYLLREAGERNAKTREAENMLAMGNSLLEKGDPQQARRAFQSAYGLSQGDDAFNEDARVQLNNLKLQQALIGLNVSRAEAAGGDASALGGNFRDLRARKDVNYTQQDAKDIIDRNSSDENTAFMALAKRLVEQQDAAVSSPAVIRANIPEQGRVLTFQRAVAADQWADLNIGLKARAAQAASSGTRLMILIATFFGLALLGCMARAGRNRSRDAVTA